MSGKAMEAQKERATNAVYAKDRTRTRSAANMDRMGGIPVAGGGGGLDESTIS